MLKDLFFSYWDVDHFVIALSHVTPKFELTLEPGVFLPSRCLNRLSGSFCSGLSSGVGRNRLLSAPSVHGCLHLTHGTSHQPKLLGSQSGFSNCPLLVCWFNDVSFFLDACLDLSKWVFHSSFYILLFWYLKVVFDTYLCLTVCWALRMQQMEPLPSWGLCFSGEERW